VEQHRVTKLLVERLRERALERGWRIEEKPHGAGTIATIFCTQGTARVAAYGSGQLLVLEAPPALRAELLIWKATLAAFEGNTRIGRYERHD